MKSSPATLPAPARASQPSWVAPSSSGIPLASAAGTTTTNPVSITHASTDDGSSSRVAREAVSSAPAQQKAAPSPPSTAITGHSYSERAAGAPVTQLEPARWTTPQAIRSPESPVPVVLVSAPKVVLAASGVCEW